MEEAGAGATADAPPSAADVEARLRAAISETGGSLGVLLRDALRVIETLTQSRDGWRALSRDLTRNAEAARARQTPSPSEVPDVG